MKALQTIYSVAARHKGEVLAHCITRTAFLRHVVADPRTRNLFSYWADTTGVDAVVEHMVGLLDAAARRAGLARRSMLRRQEHAVHLAPLLGVLQHREAEYERLLVDGMPGRVQMALGWIVAELFGTTNDADVPIRAWLTKDLLTVFRWEVAGHVWGEPVGLNVPYSPTLTEVPNGQTPKGDGEHLRRNAEWYYRTRVRKPRTTIEQIAKEYRDMSHASLQPRDRVGIEERPDTKVVRAGIKTATRLLELPVPPEQWSQYFENLQ